MLRREERMLVRQVILGFLRDGRQRHGYELMLENRARSGDQLSAGNFYRELAKLAEEGLVRPGTNPPDADQRRIPYSLTEKGTHVFDEWLMSPLSERDEIACRLMFADRIPQARREALFERWHEMLWIEGKQLVRAREDVLLAAERGGRQSYNPLPALLNRQIAVVSVELKFLSECLQLLGDGSRPARAEAAAPPASTVESASVERSRTSSRRRR
jgi:DNA-binding PadR family transcriptional regulator